MKQKQDWLNHYKTTAIDVWRGRNDTIKGKGTSQERFHQIIQSLDLTKENLTVLNKYDQVLLGFACDAGVARNQGRVGAVAGPEAIRRAMVNLTCPTGLTIVDVGDILCPDDDLELAQTHLANLVASILAKGCSITLLGGGHEIAWAHYQGIELAGEVDSLAIVNIDAHFDMRPLIIEESSGSALGSSGTSFLQIAHSCQKKQRPFAYCVAGLQPRANTQALYMAAEQWGVKIITAEEIQQQQKQNDKVDDVLDFIAPYEKVYLTVCLDAFAEAVAPGVSAPQALGLYPYQIMPLLRALWASGKVCYFDIAEYAPNLDRNNMTARLAAALVAENLLAWSV